MKVDQLKDDALNRLAIVKQEHSNWLALPMTRALLTKLNDHEQSIIDTIGNGCMSDQISSEHIRRLGVQLQKTRTLKKLIHDTDTFIAKCPC